MGGNCCQYRTEEVNFEVSSSDAEKLPKLHTRQRTKNTMVPVISTHTNHLRIIVKAQALVRGHQARIYTKELRMRRLTENGPTLIKNISSGKGIYKFSDGSTYTGEFDGENIHGKGLYKWIDGRTYNGDWTNNKMDGTGLFLWPDGRKYNGQYHDDKKNGFGLFVWSNGAKYEGYWESGAQHGEGVYIDHKQYSRRGKWAFGELIKWY